MTDGQLAVALVLVSALMHATWNAIVKLSGERLAVMAVIDTLCLCLSLLLTTLVPFPPAAAWPFLAASALERLPRSDASLLRLTNRHLSPGQQTSV